jgi:hypothetical protein
MKERRLRLLLLGKAAVVAHRYERPLAAEMDEFRQSALPRKRSRARCCNARKGAVYK